MDTAKPRCGIARDLTDVVTPPRWRDAQNVEVVRLLESPQALFAIGKVRIRDLGVLDGVAIGSVGVGDLVFNRIWTIVGHIAINSDQKRLHLKHPSYEAL